MSLSRFAHSPRPLCSLARVRPRSRRRVLGVPRHLHRGKDGSKGIYRCEARRRDRQARPSRNWPPRWAARRSSTIHPNGKFLYAVGEGGGKDGGAGRRVRPRRQDRAADEAERGQERRRRAVPHLGPPEGRRTRSSPTTAAAARPCSSSATDGKLGERIGVRPAQGQRHGPRPAEGAARPLRVLQPDRRTRRARSTSASTR